MQIISEKTGEVVFNSNLPRWKDSKRSDACIYRKLVELAGDGIRDNNITIVLLAYHTSIKRIFETLKEEEHAVLKTSSYEGRGQEWHLASLTLNEMHVIGFVCSDEAFGVGKECLKGLSPNIILCDLIGLHNGVFFYDFVSQVAMPPLLLGARLFVMNDKNVLVRITQELDKMVPSVTIPGQIHKCTNDCLVSIENCTKEEKKTLGEIILQNFQVWADEMTL